MSSAERSLVEKRLQEQSPDLLKDLPAKKKEQLLNFLQNSPVFYQQITASSSPVPPAELLAGYNREITDGANRLFTLVEKQSDHRQILEKKVISSQTRATAVGQWLGFILVLLLIGVATWLGLTGHDALAGTVFSVTIGSVVGAFLVGRRAQDRNLDKKAPK